MNEEGPAQLAIKVPSRQPKDEYITCLQNKYSYTTIFVLQETEQYVLQVLNIHILVWRRLLPLEPGCRRGCRVQIWRRECTTAVCVCLGFGR